MGSFTQNSRFWEPFNILISILVFSFNSSWMASQRTSSGSSQGDLCGPAFEFLILVNFFFSNDSSAFWFHFQSATPMLPPIPADVVVAIASLVIASIPPICHRNALARLRSVCHLWKHSIDSNPAFLRPIFINTWSVPFPLASLGPKPVDVAWHIEGIFQGSDSANIQACSVASLLSSAHHPIRSLHITFSRNTSLMMDPVLLQQISPGIIAFLQPPNLSAIQHLHLHFMPVSAPMPTLEYFTQLISLEVVGTNLPIIRPGFICPVQYIYIRTEDGPEDDSVHPFQWINLFNGTPHLHSLHLHLCTEFDSGKQQEYEEEVEINAIFLPCLCDFSVHFKEHPQYFKDMIEIILSAAHSTLQTLGLSMAGLDIDDAYDAPDLCIDKV